MIHLGKARSGASVIGAVLVAGLAAACGTREPPPDFGAPATPREWRILGVDASDPYFLNRFRRCVQWKSEQLCRQEPYGDGEGGFP